MPAVKIEGSIVWVVVNTNVGIVTTVEHVCMTHEGAWNAAMMDATMEADELRAEFPNDRTGIAIVQQNDEVIVKLYSDAMHRYKVIEAKLEA